MLVETLTRRNPIHIGSNLFRCHRRYEGPLDWDSSAIRRDNILDVNDGIREISVFSAYTYNTNKLGHFSFKLGLLILISPPLLLLVCRLYLVMIFVSIIDLDML